ncbi:MAG: VWA domain-containing protein [Acidobacteria bacterium]|nr:MAG: VWA domain-containing protein [Acidobacteriota bacterium]REK02333.1 MAG: VWA domain-containing protein [Acidobacteriota bacterium]REK13865.1 MAG: VWA domain-containing protein [Acidobacteriota bacterium]REK41860.1 MAG: VWA domain-containing protein [Acidobacteriota bacterium]
MLKYSAYAESTTEGRTAASDSEIQVMKQFSRVISVAILFVAFASVAEAQDPVDDDVISVDTSIVRLNVGVVNPSGSPVTNLSRNDFKLFEDGVEQEIVRFEPVAAPFSLVMILDMSGSTLSFRQTIRTSAIRFLDALAATDRVAIVEFYDKVNVLNDFTTDREKLIHSITVANGRGKTQLYKSLDTALEKLSKEGSRRKAVIVLTDGVDTDVRNLDREVLGRVAEDKMAGFIEPENSSALNQVLRKASNQGVTIYPLALPTGDPAKLVDPSPIQVAMYSAARERLDILASRTGGMLNTINRLEEMGRLYAQVAGDIRSLYTIEYQPGNEKKDGKWREIKVELAQPELIPRTRPGYFAN